VLGGSTEGSALARQLSPVSGLEVISSLAGLTATPARTGDSTRTGGFGGVDGLIHWLEEEGVDAVVDATHPFSAQMPWQAARACAATGVPRVRLRRPGWTAQSGDRWTRVGDLDAAARALAQSGARRAFLTIGSRHLGAFAGADDVWFLVRSIESPEPMPLARAELVLSRGPFDLAGERQLLVSRRIDAVVTNDSGGTATAAKLDAARALELPVVMVDRPPDPPGPLVATVDEAAAWCSAILGWGEIPGAKGRPDSVGP
jgi:precorrin-6A/cobalt-precorrin-6A reductase